MSYEAALGGEILGDAVAGGAAGAGFGGLLGYGLTASMLEQLAKGDDALLRRFASSLRLRNAAVGTAGVLGALVGGAAGFGLGGGSRWIGGRPRAVEKRGAALKQLASIKGLPTQFRTANSIAPAAKPATMKLPSTMAREHNAAGMVTKKIAEDPMKYVKKAAASPAPAKRWVKKASGPTHVTGIVGDSSAPGLFSATAEALIGRSPTSVDEVLSDSEPYQALKKATYRKVRT